MMAARVRHSGDPACRRAGPDAGTGTGPLLRARGRNG